MSRIQIKNGVCRKPEWRLNKPVNFCLEDREQIAIVGPNGGGKTLLVDIITGRHPLLGSQPIYDFGNDAGELISDNMKYIAFRDTYGGDSDSNYYLQQRWNQTEIDKDMPTTGEKLEEAYRMAGKDTPERRKLQQQIYDTLGIDDILDKQIIMLSSGELRKYALACSLFAAPKILIMDNPFIGLDAQARDMLHNLLAQITSTGRIQLILVLSKTDDIPRCITHVVPVTDKCVGEKLSREEFLVSRTAPPAHVLEKEKADMILALPRRSNNYNAQCVVNMKDVTIKYGNRTILNSISWKINNGEWLGFKREEWIRKIYTAKPHLR